MERDGRWEDEELSSEVPEDGRLGLREGVPVYSARAPPSLRFFFLCIGFRRSGGEEIREPHYGGRTSHGFARECRSETG